MDRIVRRVGDRAGSKVITSVEGSVVQWRCDTCGTMGSMTSRGWGMARTCCGGEFVRNRNRLLIVWTDIKSRTSDPNHPAYSRYSQLSVSGWNSFSEFSDWAKSNGYRYGLDIDRIDNSKGYSPENCRFVTRSENNRNRKSNRLLAAFGETKTLVEWSQDDRCSVQAQTIAARLDRYGWHDTERAIAAPRGAGKL